ncbi:DUF3253 domain-containing protein [uncultured Pseudacidovorax sp.]|uniref:DUF3253 domain-containing protein n=1 Tax=uncultured Pseudacidovorax sp. TaxID=679313 RepID=UPI0025DC1E75|nr:DUF3253 domain-containing protein [uncultured Pseudacidovorax sp.]
MRPTDATVRLAIADLLSQRAAEATVCPSEVARALSAENWRPLMPQVRAVAIDMARQGRLEIRQRGTALSPDAELHGPIRLSRRASMASAETDTAGHPTTPDGRYFVVRGRLWRKANPDLPQDKRDALVRQLMDARRALRGRRSDAERQAAREQVDQAKRALGERGPVWWTDGAPDFNRRMARNTPYRDWFAALPDD